MSLARNNLHSTYSFSLGLYGGYESNIEFFVPDGPSDAWGSARASLSHTKRSPRGNFSLSLDGAGTRYQDNRSFDRIDGSGSLAASRQLSERSTLSFSGSASYLPTELSRILITSGVQLPRDSTLGISGGLGLDIRSGEKGTVGFNLRYDRIDFESPRPPGHPVRECDLPAQSQAEHPQRSLVQLRLPPDLRRGVQVRQPLGRARVDAPDPPAPVLSVASGAGYSREPIETGELAESWHYYGTAGLDGRIRRSTINLQFRRSVNPAYGLGGNVLSYGALLSWSIPIGKARLPDVRGVHTWSEDPTSQTEQFVSDDANASLSFQFVRELGMSLDYGYRRSDPAAGEVVESHRASIGFIYTFSRPSARY